MRVIGMKIARLSVNKSLCLGKREREQGRGRDSGRLLLTTRFTITGLLVLTIWRHRHFFHVKTVNYYFAQNAFGDLVAGVVVLDKMCNSESLRKLSCIKYMKILCIFVTGGAHVPYAPRMATPFVMPLLLIIFIYTVTVSPARTFYRPFFA